MRPLSVDNKIQAILFKPFFAIKFDYDTFASVFNKKESKIILACMSAREKYQNWLESYRAAAPARSKSMRWLRIVIGVSILPDFFTAIGKWLNHIPLDKFLFFNPEVICTYALLLSSAVFVDLYIHENKSQRDYNIIGIIFISAGIIAILKHSHDMGNESLDEGRMLIVSYALLAVAIVSSFSTKTKLYSYELANAEFNK